MGWAKDETEDVETGHRNLLHLTRGLLACVFLLKITDEFYVPV